MFRAGRGEPGAWRADESATKLAPAVHELPCTVVEETATMIPDAPMAEIRIQRKRRQATWPLLLVILLPITYLLYWGSGRTMTSGGEVSLSTAPASYMIPRDTVAPPDPVALYANFVTPATASLPDESAARAYSSRSIRLLADGLETLSAADAPSNVKSITLMRGEATALAADINPVNPPRDGGDRMRSAAIAAADVMESVQHAAYPEARIPVSRVRDAAGRIRTGVSLAAQPDQLRNFLLIARDALAAMHAPAGAQRESVQPEAPGEP